MEVRPSPSAAQVQAPPALGPMGTLHRAVSRPIASLVLLLGFAPGQLSLQSLTLTLVGLARMWGGSWEHVAQGAGIAYAGILLDRADQWVMEKRGRPSAWTVYLGIAVDRLVEVSLVVGAAVVAVAGQRMPLESLVPASPTLVVVLAAVGAGLVLAHRALVASADMLILRQHLLTRQRLPAPVAFSRHAVARPFFARLVGRDEVLLGWAVSLTLGQAVLFLVALGVAAFLWILEDLVLLHRRLKEPEVHASALLGPDPP